MAEMIAMLNGVRVLGAGGHRQRLAPCSGCQNTPPVGEQGFVGVLSGAGDDAVRSTFGARLALWGAVGFMLYMVSRSGPRGPRMAVAGINRGVLDKRVESPAERREAKKRLSRYERREAKRNLREGREPHPRRQYKGWVS